MGLSRSARIITLLVIDSAFFFVELIVGYAVGSLALVADSFHMLNDVLSLLVALYTIKLATSPSTAANSYGWQRAEILGALINGVFLVALCVSIALEAVGRFFAPPEISNPKIIVIVGSLGLLSNVVGLFLFHEHGHSHGHSHGDISLPQSADETDTTDGPQSRPRQRADSMSSLYAHPAQTRAQVIETAHEFGYGRSPSPPGDFPAVMSPPSKHGRMPSSSRKSHRQSASRPRNARKGSGNVNVPVVGENETLPPTAGEGSSSASTSTAVETSVEEHGRANGKHDHAHKHDHAGDHHNHSHMAKDAGAAEEGNAHDHSHDGHGSHGGHGGGHSHGSMNMRGVFLHVMGDALGNVGVITAGLVLWFCEGRWTLYFDPGVSLLITVIIFSSAIPLVKSASYILMQGVPSHVSLEAVRSDIKLVDGVVSVHELHIWQLSESTVVASVHVLISHGTDYMVAANGIRQGLHKHGVHSVTIQPEFVSGDSNTSEDEEETACLIRCPPDQCGTDTCCPPKAATGTLVDVEESSEGHGSHDGHNHA